MDTFNFFS